jgi:hypothetical protein
MRGQTGSFEFMPLAHEGRRPEPSDGVEAASETRKVSVFAEYNIVVTLLVVAAVVGTVLMVGTLAPIRGLSIRALSLVIASR